jgi:hypothetical protein
MVKPNKNSLSLAICFFILISGSLFAQKGLFSRQKVVNQYATVGIGGGSSHYFGDLAPYKYAYYGIYTNVRWNGSINYTRFLTSNAAARVSFAYARLAGDDATFAQRNINKLAANYIRNLHFRNDLQEFTLSGLFNILPQYGKGAKGRSSFMPYIAVGVGLYGHNPKARGSVTDKTTQAFINPTDAGTPTRQPWTALKPLRTSGQGLPGYTTKPYSLVQPVMPIAIGLRMKINNNFDFTAEAGLRVTPFDYLDDVGLGSYPPRTLLSSTGGNQSADFSYRADEDYNAKTLELRLVKFWEAANIVTNGTSGSSSPPSTNAGNIYDYTKDRGTKRIDSYILTQFTISYILSNNIKCPPIR